MYIGRVGQAGSYDHTNDQANHQSQTNTQQVETHIICTRIAHQQIGNKGRNTGGEEGSVQICAQLLLFQQGDHRNAQHCGPHIQHIDAPGTEA